MATLVQNANTNHAFNSGNTVITPGSATTAGNTLIVAGSGFGPPGDSIGITDSAGNTWTIGTTNVTSQNPPAAYDSASQNDAFVAWVFNAASVTTVTLSSSGGPTAFYAADATLSEWSGLTTRSDSSAATGNTGTIEPPALTLATSSDVVVAAAAQQFSSTLTPGVELTAFSSDATGQIAYAQPGSAGSFQPEWGASAHEWAAAAAAFTPGNIVNVPAGLASSSAAAGAGADAIRLGMTIRGS